MAIIYEGPSLYDGSPIVVIATSNSRNRKTGDMVQTWILRADIHPIEASRIGADKAICGTCPHMGTPAPEKGKGWALGRSCYVSLAHAPAPVWQAYKRGSYPNAIGHKATREIGLGRMVRLGSYGDVAAVPGYVWSSLLDACQSWTAYTHGKVNPDPERIMTSAESLLQAESAWAKGERTFRLVKDVSDVVKSREVLCPASEEAKRKATCQTCKLCAGASVKAKSIAIVAHGPAHIKRNAMERISQ